MLIRLRKKTASYFSNIHFVMQAVAPPDEFKCGLHLLKVECGWAEATDGHRLHGAFVGDNIADGFYEKIRYTKTHIVLHRCDDETKISYPKTHKVHPAHLEHVRFDINTRCFDQALTTFYRSYHKKGLTVKYRFLESIFLAMSGISVYYYHASQPLVFWDNIKNDKWAVVMPMRIDIT